MGGVTRSPYIWYSSDSIWPSNSHREHDLHVHHVQLKHPSGRIFNSGMHKGIGTYLASNPLKFFFYQWCCAYSANLGHICGDEPTTETVVIAVVQEGESYQIIIPSPNLTGWYIVLGCTTGTLTIRSPPNLGFEEHSNSARVSQCIIEYLLIYLQGHSPQFWGLGGVKSQRGHNVEFNIIIPQFFK
jgi:hypothetical protein